MPRSSQSVSTHAVVHVPAGLPSSRYGRFVDAGRAFVVTDVLTPRPWANVMANGEYGLVVTQAGGGFSWLRNCQTFRLTRWAQDLVCDREGRWLYVADGETLWSTTLRPTPTPADLDEVTHGLGYTTFRRIVNGVESEHTVFVPAEGSCEVWLVTLRELSGSKRRLRVAPAVEWHLGAPGELHREYFRLFVSLQAGEHGVVAWKRPGLVEHTRRAEEAEFAAVLGVSGLAGGRWFTDKLDWLGRRGDPARPEALGTGRMPVTTGRWDDPVAAGVYEVALPAGGETRFVVVLGAGPTPDEARATLATWEVASAERALAEVREGYASRWGTLSLRTGDAAIDAMVNAWLPHQAMVGRMVARCALYQQGGAYGYRDQLQDSLAFLDQEPHVTLAQIGLNAEAM